MDSTIKLLVAILVFVIVMMAVSLAIMTKDVGKQTQRYKDQVGTQVILEGDTLTVIDYSMWTDSFTLTGGVTVDSKLVFDE